MAIDKNVKHLPEHGPVDENGREILLSLKNVDITFGKGDKAVKAVKNASFDIYKGETFSLVGESGSGKTTIGRAVIRVNPCAAGEIQYKGVRISGKTSKGLDREVIRNIQMIFQDPASSLNERATVDYIISEGLYNFKLFKNEEERIHKVENMIDLILKAIPTAMGVAVVVTSLLGELDVRSGFSMLGIGLACLGIYLLKRGD